VAADAVPNEAIARTNAPQTLLKNLIVANLRKIDRNIFVKQLGIQKHANALATTRPLPETLNYTVAAI
jgi:hypothetical protein